MNQRLMAIKKWKPRIPFLELMKMPKVVKLLFVYHTHFVFIQISIFFLFFFWFVFYGLFYFFHISEGQQTRRAPIIVSAGTISSEMTSPSKNISGIAKSVIVRASHSSNPSNSTSQVSFNFNFCQYSDNIFFLEPLKFVGIWQTPAVGKMPSTLSKSNVDDALMALNDDVSANVTIETTKSPIQRSVNNFFFCTLLEHG